MRVGARLNVGISCRPLSVQGLLVSAGTDPNLLHPVSAPGQQIWACPGPGKLSAGGLVERIGIWVLGVGARFGRTCCGLQL